MKLKHSDLQKAPPRSSLRGPGRRELWAQRCATGPGAGPKSPRWEQRGRGSPDGQPSPTLGRRGPRAQRRRLRTRPQTLELTPERPVLPQPVLGDCDKPVLPDMGTTGSRTHHFPTWEESLASSLQLLRSVEFRANKN